PHKRTGAGAGYATLLRDIKIPDKPFVRSQTNSQKKNFFRNVPFYTPFAFKTPINTNLQKKTTCKKLPIFYPFLTKFDQMPKNSLFLYKKLPIFDPPDSINKIQQTAQKMLDMTQRQIQVLNATLFFPDSFQRRI
ncbi:hypothetical protein EZS27_031703, partial [termite gut metagenome]